MMQDPLVLASGASAALFALTFLFGGHAHPLQSIIRDRRTLISFGAGISTGYLFVRMMPELAEAEETLSAFGAWTGMLAYLAALIGFLLVYGLDHFHRSQRRSASRAATAAGGDGRGKPEKKAGHRAFGIGIYVLLLTYVLVREPGTSVLGTLQYAVAIAFHFLAVDHSLQDEMGASYDHRGRFVLAGLCLLGWGLAWLVKVPDAAVALLLAFVSGAVIMNSAVMELPEERDGRFLPFAVGSVGFGLVLMSV
jgi:hypothetical protein